MLGNVQDICVPEVLQGMCGVTHLQNGTMSAQRVFQTLSSPKNCLMMVFTLSPPPK